MFAILGTGIKYAILIIISIGVIIALIDAVKSGNPKIRYKRGFYSGKKKW